VVVELLAQFVVFNSYVFSNKQINFFISLMFYLTGEWQKAGLSGGPNWASW